MRDLVVDALDGAPVVVQSPEDPEPAIVVVSRGESRLEDQLGVAVPVEVGDRRNERVFAAAARAVVERGFDLTVGAVEEVQIMVGLDDDLGHAVVVEVVDRRAIVVAGHGDLRRGDREVVQPLHLTVAIEDEQEVAVRAVVEGGEHDVGEAVAIDVGDPDVAVDVGVVQRERPELLAVRLEGTQPVEMAGVQDRHHHDLDVGRVVEVGDGGASDPERPFPGDGAVLAKDRTGIDDLEHTVPVEVEDDRRHLLVPSGAVAGCLATGAQREHPLPHLTRHPVDDDHDATGVPLAGGARDVE